MTTTNKIELMAPAGNFESLQAGLDNGADSVYFGVEQLNMRARATVNFTMEDLPEIARRCEAKNVRSYLTLNTIIYDHDLSVVKTLIGKSQRSQYHCSNRIRSSGNCHGERNRNGSSYFDSAERNQCRNRKIL